MYIFLKIITSVVCANIKTWENVNVFLHTKVNSAILGTQNKKAFLFF